MVLEVIDAALDRSIDSSCPPGIVREGSASAVLEHLSSQFNLRATSVVGGPATMGKPMLFEIALGRLIKVGTLAVTFPDGRVREFGTGEGPFAAVAIKSGRAKRRLSLNPVIDLSEASMDKELVPAQGAPFALLDFLALNAIEGGSHPLESTAVVGHAIV
ncbi:hypothetical protein CN155_10410 [Sinorhizobium meliloti]|uniref:hypothetical protein n=1 Tax=Rhizobium meliloti TaxID=382 RepID=UPI000FD92059|nr:hypothetical protein [Sinorhizobium meliloti]MDE3795795.1 hypothetical protein [Sinorhizobium meliloti]RVK58272.1 hypothetical protein CN155_10410 [Sinorhizobium meliloti]